MASGTIYGSTDNQYIDSKIVWSSTPTDPANTSSVTVSLYYKRNNTGYTTQGTGNFSITIDGQATSASKYMTITESAWVLAITATKTITHNSDGTKSITISASGAMPATSLSSTSCSGRVTLDTIARASTLTSAANKTLGNACSVKWTPLSKSFRYKLEFTLGAFSFTTGAIHPNTTSAYTYTGYDLPIADIAPEITSKPPTGTMKVTLYTYSDSEAKTQVGSASSKTFTVTVPNTTSTEPKVSMTLTPVSSLETAFSSLYIKGKSKVKATISSEGKYEAKISSTEMTVQGKSYGSPYQSGYLSTSGTVTVKVRSTDSRGYYKDIEEDITVIPYSKPSLLPATDESGIICARCDEEGNLSESGTYLKIKARRSYSKVTSDGVQKNFCSIRYRYKEETAASFSAWKTLLAKDNISTNTIDLDPISGVVSSTETSYVVQLGVIDDIKEYDTKEFLIPTDFITVDIPEKYKGKRIGVGRYAADSDESGIDVGMDMYFDEGKKIHGIYADFVKDIGLFNYTNESGTVTGSWRYRKWDSGVYDLSGLFTVQPTASIAFSNNVAYYSDQIRIQLPFDIESIQFSGTPTENFYWIVNAALADAANSIIGFRLVRFTAISTTTPVDVRIVAHGRWK